MRIQGHSADGGRHSAGRQQYRLRDFPREQQGRHLVPIGLHGRAQLRDDSSPAKLGWFPFPDVR
jgi:hypothetical protein